MLEDPTTTGNQDFQPFPKKVMVATIHAYCMIPKIDVFTRIQDLVTHVEIFRAQMMISGHLDEV